MAGETIVHIVGNLTADPDLRFTAAGAAVANFTVASTPRTFDRQSGEWKDGEALFLRCNLWRQPGENAAESLTRGMRVMVSGPAAPAVVRDPRGREAHRRRARGRRGRPVAAVRHGQGHQGQRQPRQRGRRPQRRGRGVGERCHRLRRPVGHRARGRQRTRRRRRAAVLIRRSVGTQRSTRRGAGRPSRPAPRHGASGGVSSPEATQGSLVAPGRS